MSLRIGDKIKLNREYLKPVYLELTHLPYCANINGVSGDDELFVKGYILRNDLTYDGRIKKAKPFIIRKNLIEMID